MSTTDVTSKAPYQNQYILPFKKIKAKHADIFSSINFHRQKSIGLYRDVPVYEEPNQEDFVYVR